MKRALNRRHSGSTGAKKIPQKKAKLRQSDCFKKCQTVDYTKYIESLDKNIYQLQHKTIQEHLDQNVDPLIEKLKKNDIKSKMFMFEMSNEETINNYMKSQIIEKLQEIEKYVIITMESNIENSMLAFTNKLSEFISRNNNQTTNLPLKCLIKELINNEQKNLLIIMNNCVTFVDNMMTMCSDLSDKQINVSFVVFINTNISDECMALRRSLNYSVENIPLPDDLKGNPVSILNKFVSQILFSQELTNIFIWNKNMLDYIYHLFKNNTFRVSVFQTLIKYSIMEHLDANHMWIKYFDSNEIAPSKEFIMNFCTSSISFRKFVEKQKNKKIVKNLLDDPNYIAAELKKIHQHNKDHHLLIKKVYDVFFYIFSKLTQTPPNYLKWYLKFFNQDKSIKDHNDIITCFHNKPSYKDYKEIESVCVDFCEGFTNENQLLPNTSPIHELIKHTSELFSCSYEAQPKNSFLEYMNQMIDVLYELFKKISTDFKEIMFYSDTSTINERINLSPIDSLLNSLKTPSNEIMRSDLCCVFKCLQKVVTKVHCANLFKKFIKIATRKKGRPKSAIKFEAAALRDPTKIDAGNKDLMYLFKKL